MRLRYTRRGAAELQEILVYLSARSSVGAANVMARIDAATDLLLQYPLAGRPTTKAPMRRLPASPYPYVIYYEATHNEIIVHGVRHGARRIPARFGETT